MTWSEFLERIQELDIPPEAMVLHVAYNWSGLSDSIDVETIDEPYIDG